MKLKRFVAKALRAVLQPPAITNSRLAKKARVCSGSQINDSDIDNYSYIGHDCFFVNVQVGRFSSVADNCRLGGATHPIERVSTSPVFHSGKNILKKNFANHPDISTAKIIVGHDVWIGANAIVLSGVSIGTGAVVGAGSVVTKSIPPYEIWAGNPAKKIRDRFSEETKEALLRSCWWTWDDEKIEKYALKFNDPAAFIEQLREEESK